MGNKLNGVGDNRNSGAYTLRKATKFIRKCCFLDRSSVAVDELAILLRFTSIVLKIIKGRWSSAVNELKC